jgi:hypothetical protein
MPAAVADLVAMAADRAVAAVAAVAAVGAAAHALPLRPDLTPIARGRATRPRVIGCLS